MNQGSSSVSLCLCSVPVADIKGLLMGKDCPHMKENKGKQNKVSSSKTRSFLNSFFFFHFLGGCVGESQRALVFVLQEVLDLSFTITYDVEEYSLNFVAPSRTDVSLARREWLGCFWGGRALFSLVNQRLLLLLPPPSCASSACGRTD